MAKTADIDAFLDAVDDPTRRAEARQLDGLFREVTGWSPRLWGKLVGYGRYDYVYDSGRAGQYFATGFGLRKAGLSVYIMPGYGEFGDILGRIGRHKMGKACLNIDKLADVDVDVLAELIQAGVDRLTGIYPVTPE